MEKINIRFERDPSLDHIDVTVRAPERDADVEKLMEELARHPLHPLAVFDGDGNIRTLPEKDVVLASVEGKFVNIVTEDGSWYTRRTLQSLENEFDRRWFIRVSRYELVNLRKVIRYDFTVSGTLRLELAGGRETWASRRCIPLIRRRLLGKE